VSGPSTPGGTEDRLREVFDALAGSVQASPGAFRRAQAEWRRRERRRRLVTGLLVLLVIALADVVGLWALNRAEPQSRVIFDKPGTSVVREVPNVGPP
jgi:hypothetical protein